MQAVLLSNKNKDYFVTVAFCISIKLRLLMVTKLPYFYFLCLSCLTFLLKKKIETI